MKLLCGKGDAMTKLERRKAKKTYKNAVKELGRHKVASLRMGFR